MKEIIKNKNLFFLYLVFAAGIMLRIYGLGGQNVRMDEFITAGASNGNIFYVFLNSMANNAGQPLFYILESIVCSIFGYSEAALRLLPMIFGIACMFIFYRLVRALISEYVSLIAAALFCLNPWQVALSQEAGGYTLFLMCSLLMTYYLLMSVKFNSFVKGKFIFWSVAAIYTNGNAMLLLLIMNALIILRYRGEIRPGLWLRAQAVIGVSLLPMLFFYLKMNYYTQEIQNIGLWFAPVDSVKNYLFGTATDWNIFSVPAFIAALFFMVMGAFTYRHKYMKITDIIFWLSLSFLAVPWVISIVFSSYVYSDIYMMIVSALVLILFAVGFSYMSMEGVIISIAAVMLLYAVAFSNTYSNESFRKADYKKQFAEIMTEFKDGDIIIHSGKGSYSCFEYYNRYVFKTNYENRYLGEIPETTGSLKKLVFVGGITSFRDDLLKKLGIETYQGYDKNIMTPKEALEKIRTHKRVWFIRENKKGMKQTMQQCGRSWNLFAEPVIPVQVEKIPWVNRYFKISREERFPTDEIYLMEVR